MINGAITSRRFRAIALIAIGSIAVWKVITASLAAYLAAEAPAAAIMLNSREPTALVALADRRLNPKPEGEGTEATRVAPQVADEKSEASPDAHNRLAGLAETALKSAVKWASKNEIARPQAVPRQPGLIPTSLTETELRQIRVQAELALTSDPLNARALRILGQIADGSNDEVLATKLMKAAARRSLRERFAIYWLMQKSLEKENATAALGYADALIRTRPQLLKFAMPILVQMAENRVVDAKDALISFLASNPPWRAQFFSALPSYVSIATTPRDVLLSLKNTATPPTPADLQGYLRRLTKEKYYELAYYTWLQFLPPEQLSNIGLLFNSSFETIPSGLPFDWAIAARSGVDVETILRPDKTGEHALYLEFGPGRADFQGVSQLLMLAPGSYKFNGTYKGELKGLRGLQWRITCADGKGALIGEGDMFIGSAPTWRELEFTFTVPGSECRAQELRLLHPARSASEQIVSGAVWYDDLRIDRVIETKQPQAAMPLTPPFQALP